jgi:hypothetical protein
VDPALPISIIALVLALVALPPTFQMIFGRPRLRTEFKEDITGAGKRLICEISNVPVRSRSLRFIGVRRDAAAILADFQVREVGTNKVIVNMTRALLADLMGNAGQFLR